jgi:hypothetical protein
MIIGIYFLIGLLYTFINIQFRKMHPEDPLLTLVWIGFWPLAFIVLFIHYLESKYKRHEL